MIRYLIIFLINFHISCSFAFSQNIKKNWLSIKRLSFTVHSTYYFNPWTNYNNALKKVTDRIRIDPFFFEPVGSYEKINGAAVLKTTLGYSVTEKFQIVFSSQYGSTNSLFEFYPDSNKISSNITSPAFHQELAFKVRSLGLEFAYRFPINKNIALIYALGLDRYKGEFDLEWRHTRGARGPLPEGSGENLQAELKENRWGWHSSFGLDIKVIGSVSFLIAVDYRNVEFSNLKGTATYHDIYDDFTATSELVESSNYFGIRLIENDNPFKCYSCLLPFLTFRTQPGTETRKPATINLTSLGIRVGLKVGF